MRTFEPRLYAALLCAAIACMAHGQTLGEALNATNLTWTTSGTGGAFPWAAETTTSHDGGSAAQSGRPTTQTATSTLQTTVTGPGTLTFWWNNASVYRTLTFSAGGNTLASLPRSSWRQQTNYLGAGTQTLSWVCSLTSPGIGDQYFGYLDEVSFTPGATAPFITAQPVTQSQPPGVDAVFIVEANGTPPLSYQWRFEGTDMPGATASSLKITNLRDQDLGNYSVLVTNSTGSILSSNALLGFGPVAAWGDPTRGDTACPLQLSNVLAVSAGNYFSLALKTDGTLAIWGYSNNGQLLLPPDLTNVQSIAAGLAHCVAFKPDGTVTSWGSDTFGQTNTPKTLGTAVAIAAGDFSSAALRSDGTLAAWGDFNAGLANPPWDLTNVAGITIDGTFALALRADGTVTKWGTGGDLPNDLAGVAAISAHANHTIALLQDGTVRAWGQNDWGQATVPAGLSNVVAVAAGAYHNLALQADGTVVAWGDNRFGQTNVPPGLKNVSAIAAGLYHSLALVGDGPPRLQVPLSEPSLSTAGFRISLPTQSGRVYALEHLDSLTDTNWFALPLVAGTGTNVFLTDPSAAAASIRFYRVRRW